MNVKLSTMFLTILFAVIFVNRAHALPIIHLEAFASTGYGGAEVEKESESPNMLIYELGGTVGYKIVPMFYIGITSSLQLVNQLSATNKNYGNRKGTRYNLVSPTIGFSLGPISLKYEYKLLGNYKLSKKTTDNKELTYEGPLGHRFSVFYQIVPLFHLGIFYENTSFDTEVAGSTETKLTNKMQLSQFGLALSAVF